MGSATQHCSRSRSASHLTRALGRGAPATTHSSAWVRDRKKSEVGSGAQSSVTGGPGRSTGFPAESSPSAFLLLSKAVDRPWRAALQMHSGTSSPENPPLFWN